VPDETLLVFGYLIWRGNLKAQAGIAGGLSDICGIT
jgi:hypothetical protein